MMVQMHFVEEFTFGQENLHGKTILPYYKKIICLQVLILPYQERLLEQYWLWYRMQFLHLLLVENVFCLKEDFLYSGSLQCM